MRQYGTSCTGSDPAMTVAIVTTVSLSALWRKKESQAVLLGFRVFRPALLETNVLRIVFPDVHREVLASFVPSYVSPV